MQEESWGYKDKNIIFKEVSVGNNVFVGTKTIILLGILIGDNCIIGAGSVIKGKLDSNSIYVGNPAVKIGNVESFAKNMIFYYSSNFEVRRMKKINVLMCCSELSVKGGMVSVVKNYLNYNDWDDYNIIYVPTHTEKNKIIVMLYFVKAYMKILKLAKSGEVKIAHLHTAERGSFYRKAILVRTLKKYGIKTIMHHHAAEFEKFYAELNDRQRKFVNKTLEMTDLNIVLSKRLVSMITDKCPTAKVEVLYNAVPVNKKNPYNFNARNILFLGRLGKRKGTYDLLEAIKIIDKNIPEDIKFYLCGDGEIEEVKNKIKKLNIEHRIAHVGWIEAEEKKEFYYNSCINVLPSYNEGLPMSILETMSYGIPNITTNIASIPEVVFDGENGYLIEPGDVTELAEKLKRILLNDKERLRFSNNAHELINNEFSLDANIKKLKEIYKKLVV